MSVYFKLKIDENEDGKIKAITVRNQKINFGLFTFLHQVVHTAIKMYNGDWNNPSGAISREREWIMREQPIQNLLIAAVKDNEENNK